MAAYAEGTTVTPEKSQADIAGLLLKYGANGFSYGWDDGRAAVMFRAKGRVVRFTVPLPNPDERRFRISDAGRARRDPDAAYQAEVRRRWRAMHLVIKAKLEAVETGVTTFEDEFMAHIVLPGTGQTIADTIRDRLEEAYRTGDPIDIVPGLPAPRAAIEGPVDAEVVG